MPVGASACRTACEVRGHRVARRRDAGVRGAAELELAAGFERDLAATGKGVGQDAENDVGCRRRGAACTRHPFELDADLRIPAGGEHPLIYEASDVVRRERAGGRGHGLAVTEVGGDPREVPDRGAPEIACSHRLLLYSCLSIAPRATGHADFVSWRARFRFVAGWSTDYPGDRDLHPNRGSGGVRRVLRSPRRGTRRRAGRRRSTTRNP